jgi:hypothetical protein
MTTNVKCNFAQVFAQVNSVEELKQIANSICQQVKIAYDERAKVLNNVIEVKVELAPETAMTATTETAPTAPQQPKKRGRKTVAQTAKEQKAEITAKQAAEAPGDTEIAITDTAAIKKLGLKFEKYNDKCWVLKGDTKPLRKALKSFRGVFNSHLSCGEGWIFKTENAAKVANALGIKTKIA